MDFKFLHITILGYVVKAWCLSPAQWRTRHWSDFSRLPSYVIPYICHALEMMGTRQRPHTSLSSVAPNTMHMDTN